MRLAKTSLRIGVPLESIRPTPPFVLRLSGPTAGCSIWKRPTDYNSGQSASLRQTSRRAESALAAREMGGSHTVVKAPIPVDMAPSSRCPNQSLGLYRVTEGIQQRI